MLLLMMYRQNLRELLSTIIHTTLYNKIIGGDNPYKWNLHLNALKCRILCAFMVRMPHVRARERTLITYV